MYGISEYGIEADERQRAVAYKAGLRALNVMLVCAFLGFIILLAMGEEVAGTALGVLGMIGLNVYGYLVEKEGWDEFIQEKIQRNPEARRLILRREIRNLVINVLFFSCFNYFIMRYSVIMAFAGAVTLAACLFVINWRQRFRKQ